MIDDKSSLFGIIPIIIGVSGSFLEYSILIYYYNNFYNSLLIDLIKNDKPGYKLLGMHHESG